MISKIKHLILELCKNQGWPWKSHIESVVKHSKELAKKLGADEEVCEISAWLHDIKKLKGEKENHHIHGSEEAEKILKELNFNEDKIKQIKHCILTHSSDKTYPPKSKEAKILASADALSHFDDFLTFTYHVYKIRNMSLSGGRNKLINKYNTAWNKLMPEAKEMVREKYKAIKLILNV